MSAAPGVAGTGVVQTPVDCLCWEGMLLAMIVVVVLAVGKFRREAKEAKKTMEITEKQEAGTRSAGVTWVVVYCVVAYLACVVGRFAARPEFPSSTCLSSDATGTRAPARLRVGAARLVGYLCMLTSCWI